MRSRNPQDLAGDLDRDEPAGFTATLLLLATHLDAGWVTRQQLRRAVVHLDSLFDIPEFMASGLLPSERIGAPPRHDRRGRLRVPLPPLLATINVDASRSTPKNLSELWQAIHAAGGLGLPADPSADELLAERTWDRIRALPASILGVSDETWTISCSRARTALRRNSMHRM